MDSQKTQQQRRSFVAPLSADDDSDAAPPFSTTSPHRRQSTTQFTDDTKQKPDNPDDSLFAEDLVESAEHSLSDEPEATGNSLGTTIFNYALSGGAGVDVAAPATLAANRLSLAAPSNEQRSPSARRVSLAVTGGRRHSQSPSIGDGRRDSISNVSLSENGSRPPTSNAENRVTLTQVQRRTDAENDDDEHQNVFDEIESLKRMPKWRRKLKWFVDHKYFEGFIIACIALNAIVLAAEDPTNENYERNFVVNVLDAVFTYIFAAELVLKLIALGLVEYRFSFFKSSWNWFDLIVIIVAAVVKTIELSSTGGNYAGLSSLRLFRVLRPIRLLTAAPTLRILVNSVLQSIPYLSDVLLMYAVSLLFFGVLGVFFFEGKMSLRCALPQNETMRQTFPNGSVLETTLLTYVPVDLRTTCTQLDAAFGHRCPWGQECVHTANDYFDKRGFDNVGMSMLTIFVTATFSGWFEVMYQTMDSTSEFAAIYHVCIAMVCSYYIINLSLVIINYAFMLNVEAEKAAGTLKVERRDGDADSDRSDDESIELAKRVKSTTPAVNPLEASSAEHINVGIRLDPVESIRHGETTPKVNNIGGVRPAAGGSVNNNTNMVSSMILDSFEASALAHSGNHLAVGPRASAATFSNDSFGGAAPLSDDMNVGGGVGAGGESTDGRHGGDDSSAAKRAEPSTLNVVRHKMRKMTRSNGFHIVVTLIICANLVTLMADHHGAPARMLTTIETFNLVFTVLFSIESAWKMMAFGKRFFRDGFNVFDLVVVVLAWVDWIFLTDVDSGISALRSFRLLRVVRLTEHFGTLQKWIATLVRSIKDAWALTFMLAFITAIYALLGMQLFGGKMCDIGDPFSNSTRTALLRNFSTNTSLPYSARCASRPRQHFDNMLNAALTLFQVLTAEDWEGPMYACMRATTDAAAVFFVTYFIIGVYTILNLFISVMLNNREQLMSEDETLAEFVKPSDAAVVVVPTASTIGAASILVDRDQHGGNLSLPVFEAFVLDGPDDAAAKKERIDTRRATIKEQASSGALCDGGEAKVRGRRRSTVAEDSVMIQSTFATQSLNHSNSNNVAGQQQQRPRSSATVGIIGETGHLSWSGGAPGEGEAAEPDDDNALRRQKSGSLALGRNGGISGVFGQTIGARAGLNGSATVLDDDNDEYLAPLEDYPPEDDDLDDAAPSADDTAGAISKVGLRKKLRLMSRRLLRDRSSLYLIAYESRTRRRLLWFVTHPYFEMASITLIFLSCIALAAENPLLPPDHFHNQVLNICSYVLTALFTLEAVLKIAAQGFVIHRHAYLRDWWNVIDFFTVIVSIIADVSAANIRFLKVFRCLRPLRFIARSEGMKLVLQSLINAIPSIGYVGIILCGVLIIFGIMGVQFFKGKFYRCTLSNYGDLDALYRTKSACLAAGYSWVTYGSNFDHLGNAFVALFETITFEGWVLLMQLGMDARSHESAPERDSQWWMAIYFVVFIVVAAFFVVNFFVAVLMDMYDMEKRRLEARFQTVKKEKLLWLGLHDVAISSIRHMRNVGSASPWRMELRRVALSHGFAWTMLVAVALNTAAIATEHTGMSSSTANIIDTIHLACQCVFFAELLSLLVVLGPRGYWTLRANRFEALITIGSWVGIIVMYTDRRDAAVAELMKMVALCRVLRLLRIVEGVRTLIATLMLSLQSILHVSGLVVLQLFFFSVLGMNLFARVDDGEEIGRRANFRNFFEAALLLARLINGEAWDGVRRDCAAQPPFCSRQLGNCGSPVMSSIFFLVFMATGMYVMLNLFVAVIVNSFWDANAGAGRALTAYHMDQFNKEWLRLDPGTDGLIRVTDIYALLENVGAPLGFDLGETPKHRRAFWWSVGRMLNEVVGYRGERFGVSRVHYFDLVPVLIELSFPAHRYELTEQEEEKLYLRWFNAFPTPFAEPVEIMEQSMLQSFAAILLQRVWRACLHRQRTGTKRSELDVFGNPVKVSMLDALRNAAVNNLQPLLHHGSSMHHHVQRRQVAVAHAAAGLGHHGPVNASVASDASVVQVLSPGAMPLTPPQRSLARGMTMKFLDMSSLSTNSGGAGKAAMSESMLVQNVSAIRHQRFGIVVQASKAAGGTSGAPSPRSDGDTGGNPLSDA